MRSANTGLSLWGTDTSGTLAGTQPGSEPRKTLRTQIKGPGKGHHPEQTRPHALAALTARRAPQEGKVSKQSHPYSQPHTRVHTHTHTSTSWILTPTCSHIPSHTVRLTRTHKHTLLLSVSQLPHQAVLPGRLQNSLSAPTLSCSPQMENARRGQRAETGKESCLQSPDSKGLSPGPS